MNILVPVEFHSMKYPEFMTPYLSEVSVNLDTIIAEPTPEIDYCLFTESAYNRCHMSSPLLDHFPVLKETHKRGVPMLWLNKKWIAEYVNFLTFLTRKFPTPKYVKVYPPFNDYCETVSEFLDMYEYFEALLVKRMPGVQILLENRYSSRYPGGTFNIAMTEEVIELADLIRKRNLNLRISLGLTEIIAINGGPKILVEERLKEVIRPLKECRDVITAVRIGGKMRNKEGKTIPGLGDLNNYFEGRLPLKECFLEEFMELFDDDTPRLFIPEVRYEEKHLESIVRELIEYGVYFQDTL